MRGEVERSLGEEPQMIALLERRGAHCEHHGSRAGAPPWTPPIGSDRTRRPQRRRPNRPLRRPSNSRIRTKSRQKPHETSPKATVWLSEDYVREGTTSSSSRETSGGVLFPLWVLVRGSTLSISLEEERINSSSSTKWSPPIASERGLQKSQLFVCFGPFWLHVWMWWARVHQLYCTVLLVPWQHVRP